jgi:hypothetical protein
MTRLAGSNRRKVSEIVFYCEKHGILNKTADVKGKASEIAKNPQWLQTD